MLLYAVPTCPRAEGLSRSRARVESARRCLWCNALSLRYSLTQKHHRRPRGPETMRPTRYQSIRQHAQTDLLRSPPPWDLPASSRELSEPPAAPHGKNPRLPVPSQAQNSTDRLRPAFADNRQYSLPDYRLPTQPPTHNGWGATRVWHRPSLDKSRQYRTSPHLQSFREYPMPGYQPQSECDLLRASRTDWQVVRRCMFD